MAGKAEKLILKNQKVPFGIITGASAMVVFFSTIGLIVAYAVTSGIAKQTSRVVSFLEEWWQTLIFVVDIVAVIVCIAAFVMYIMKKVYIGRAERREEQINGKQA